MSFTSAQAASIREYLGYPQVYRDANPRLESAITQVGSDVDASALVIDKLAKIAAIEAQIINVATIAAGVKEAEEVKLYDDASGNKVLKGLCRQGNMYCAQMAGTFGVNPLKPYFSTTGYTSDDWKQYGNGGTSGSRGSFDFNLGWR